MDNRPVVVREDSGTPAMLAVVGIIVIVAIAALFYFQPWNASQPTNHTTIINAQPAAPANNGASQGSSGGSQAGSGAAAGSGSSSSGGSGSSSGQ